MGAVGPTLRILGSLGLLGSAGPVRLGAAKQRCLLAMLALHPGEAVSQDQLAEALWGEQAPRSAANALQNHVLRLRRALKSAEGVQIGTDPAGYRLQAPADIVDARLAERLVAEGREAAREDLAEVELALGRHHDLVGELVASHPLRERRWGQLLLARYRDGRQAEALDGFHALRHTLRDELGVDPSPAGGGGGVAMVLGEAGIAKTRLLAGVRDLRAQARRAGAEQTHIRTDEFRHPRARCRQHALTRAGGVARRCWYRRRLPRRVAESQSFTVPRSPSDTPRASSPTGSTTTR